MLVLRSKFYQPVTLVLLLAALLPLSAPLSAEEDLFHRRQWFFELGGGGASVSSSLLRERRNPLFVKLAAYNMMQSPDLERQYFGIDLFNRASRRPSTSASNGRIGFEWAAGEWFGIGASFESTTVRLRRSYPVANSLGYFLLLYETYRPNQAGISILDYYVFQRRGGAFASLSPATIEVNPAIHFPGGESVDPFLRLGVGIGRVGGAAVAKAGVTLGLRIKLTRHTYFSIEGFGNRYSFSRDPKGGSSDDEEEASAGGYSAGAGGGRFMIGITF